MTTKNSYLTFNAHQDLFICCTTSGFAIYHADPFSETVRRDVPDSDGCLYAELLERTNFVAIVTRRRPDVVLIWDDSRCKVVVRLDLSAVGGLRGVRLRRDRIVVVLANQVMVYSFAARPILLQSYETADNNDGLCAVSTGDVCVLAFPGRRSGYLQTVDLGTSPQPTANSDSGNDDSANALDARSKSRPRIHILQAHNESLARIAISRDGTLVATASRHGTLVRLWSTVDGGQISELRRGADRAEICSLAFAPTSTMLAVSSDKGTIHVFVINRQLDSDAPHNRASALAKPYLMPLLPKYFTSSWSVAQVRVAEEQAEAHEKRALLGWTSDKSLVALTPTGQYLKYLVRPDSKERRDRLDIILEARRSF